MNSPKENTPTPSPVPDDLLSFFVFDIKDRLLLAEACLTPPCKEKKTNLVFIGNGFSKEYGLAKNNTPLSFFLQEDKKRTGESTYVLKTTFIDVRLLTHTSPPKDHGLIMEGELWRGAPNKGGQKIATNIFVQNATKISLKTKRPVSSAYQNWCYLLFKDDTSFKAVPAFTPISEANDVLDVQIVELRANRSLFDSIGLGNWIIFDPQMLSSGRQTEAKLRTFGKFYLSRIQAAQNDKKTTP